MRAAMFLSVVLGLAPLTLQAAEPAPLPELSGVAVVNFDRLLKFRYQSGAFVDCVSDADTSFGNLRDYQECKVQGSTFTLERQNLGSLVITLDSLIYSETEVNDIVFKVYNITGVWIDDIDGTRVQSRVALTVVNENGLLTATLRNAKFDLKAPLVLDNNAAGLE